MNLSFKNEFKSQVTALAQNWANTLAARNIFAHSGTPGYGENIYATTSRSVSGRDPVDLFYAEIKYYNYHQGKVIYIILLNYFPFYQIDLIV